ncbi:hypothetical protein LDI01_21850 [Lentilactobacillus diolivorans]|uniref:Extracellular matrix-binding protein ebh GA module domain-containing protein n=3 Tax=Lentilactobacillus diolivorans TaxID=179838 RepID=A0A0R1SFU1_9LACO|nr:hypothetical protein FC85_GL000046 [Lentilactobacillus diolivorans DSM 14421]GEP24592.1 hypothetical protein LDI01_21850 [Lentilactobacillus diolivorans]
MLSGQAKAQNDINKASKDSSSSSALSDAKSSAKSAIDAMTDLTDAQKSAYEKAVDNAKTASDVQNVLNQAITQNTINKAKNDASKLADAKSESSKLIDELTNLTKDQQDAFKKAIDSATDASTIQSIVDQAKAQDAINKSTSDDTQTSLNNAKTAAKQAVDSMTNLTDQQKSDLKSKIDSATSTSEVQQLLDQAKTQDLINKAINDKTSSSLQDAKDQAKKLIDELNSLTQQEKDDIKKQIDDASSASDIQKAVDNATKTNDENQTNITNSKTTATKTITNLTDLTDEQRTEYINKIKNATTQDEIDQIIKDATAQSSINKSKNDSSSSSALDQAKSDTKDAIDSLSHLTQSEKDAFDKELSNAKTAEEIQQILDQAKAQDQINQSKSDTSSTTALSDAKTAAKTSIDSMNNLTDQQKSDYKKAIDAAKDASTIESILNEAKAQDQINKSKSDTSDAQALANAKTAATSAINSLVNLSQSQKDAFNNAVDAATSASQLEDIINQAKAQDAINQASKDSSSASDLTAAKTAASSAIDQLSNLTGAQKDAFKQLVQDAKTAASVQDALNSAFAQDALNKAQSDSKALAYAKQIAKNTIDGLSDLTDSQKSDFESQVDAASTAAGVQKAVNAAQAQNAANQIKDGSNDNALAEIKAIANATIDGLSNLNADQKQTWKDEVTKATTPADVGTVLKNAISANDNAKPADLTAAKKAATDTINGLKNLTSDQTAAYLKAVGAATSKDGITTIVNQATAQDAINAANKDSSKLQDAKDAADKAIDGMTNLSSDQKKQFKSDVDNAKDAAGVQTALDAAAAANKSTVTTDLTAAKKAATDTINGLKNLTAAETAAYVKAVGAASTTDGITTIVNQAKAQDALNAAVNDASKLADAKTAAKAAIDSMSNLNADQKTTYKSDVDKATTVAGVQTALDAAAKANNTPVTPDLTAAKAAAIATIKGLSHLSASQIADYTSKVNAATTQKQIDDIVTDAKNANNGTTTDLTAAKAAAIDTINGLNNLSATDKAGYISSVNSATSQSAIDTVVAKAKAANDAAGAGLDAAKTAAATTIKGLSSLTTAQTAAYLSAVDSATSKDAIDSVVSQAKAQDAINAANKDANDAAKLTAAQTAAKNAIDGMTDLTADQKTQFKSDVDNAKDAAGVQKALDAATSAQKAAADLAKAKTDVISSIYGLKNLKADEKQDYANQINNATSTDAIQTILNVAEAKDQEEGQGGSTGGGTTGGGTTGGGATTGGSSSSSTSSSSSSTGSSSSSSTTGSSSSSTGQTSQDVKDAQTAANKTIDGLSNLTAQQKQDLKDQIANATDTSTINSLLQDAKTQNTKAAKTTAAKGTVVYATKKIYMYKNPTFKKSERVATYGTKPRVNRPMFVVTGTAKTSKGTLRYKVRDANRGSATYGKTGYITARSSYVSPVYYASVPSTKKVTVISPNGINAYKNAGLSGSAKHYKQGTVLKVKAIEKHNLTTRYELSNGLFITANKKLVKAGTQAQVSRVKIKKAVKVYRTANLTGAKKTLKAGKTLSVKGWAYSRATSTKSYGAKRYAVTGGYITANSNYVKVVRTTK